jgi:arylsulfatase A-like enzyme
MTRPNFLFIITDQHRADYLGCYGHPILKTPNIDSIAARGTRFERFYVATPVCMPNRATLVTGRMPSLHGVRSNGLPLSLQSNTFVDVLRAGGYGSNTRHQPQRVHLSGKLGPRLRHRVEHSGVLPHRHGPDWHCERRIKS